jgi:hypothetical protein
MDWIEWLKWIGIGLVVLGLLAAIIVGALSWFLTHAD